MRSTHGGGDVSELLGMHSRAAGAFVGIFVLGIVFAAFGTLDNVSARWPIVLAVFVITGGAITLIKVAGDPLPWPATLAVIVAGPLSCGLVLAVLPVPVHIPLQTWPLGAGTAVYTFLCVRGRTWSAWLGLAGMVAVCIVWSADTGQGWLHGVTMSVISTGPLLMATFLAYTIRPSVKTIFDLRERGTRQIADEAASAAAITERDAQLNRLDALARPMLERIASGKSLTTDEAMSCRLLEAHLRDSLRAPALATPPVNSAARSARGRGVDVVLLDDHGMDDASEGARQRLIVAIVDLLDWVQSGTVTVRIFPPHRIQMASVLLTDGADSRRREFGHDGRELDDRHDATGYRTGSPR